MSKIPIFRFRTLLFTTISKPIARQIESISIKNNMATKCLYNIGYVSDNLSYQIHKISKPECIKKEYDDKLIVEAGSEVISEILLLSILGYYVWNYYKNQQKEKKELINKIEKIQRTLDELTSH